MGIGQSGGAVLPSAESLALFRDCKKRAKGVELCNTIRCNEIQILKMFEHGALEPGTRKAAFKCFAGWIPSGRRRPSSSISSSSLIERRPEDPTPRLPSLFLSFRLSPFLSMGRFGSRGAWASRGHLASQLLLLLGVLGQFLQLGQKQLCPTAIDQLCMLNFPSIWRGARRKA